MIPKDTKVYDHIPDDTEMIRNDTKKCNDIGEVRKEIDRIDDMIVNLIAERGQYVRQAAGFKKNSDDVKAPDRVEKVIAGVREKAENCGGDPDITEAVYRTMISCFIDAETIEFNSKKEGK
ncbi:isochorismate pyruvate lyase [Ruminococcus albus]|uniref:Isochorismate pyruvate lyase n=2 Tax=Ruminococcus albus TaxID=1264 RepID=A0A1H7FIZ2_RUMAL|nr:chorismate mutase [Ruminococcus albus]SEK26001.1 isochorismate pyruvate lyase [Ruminococcus albus]